MKKIFHIVGAGRVGRTLALLLGTHPDWQFSHIVSSKPDGAVCGAVAVADVADLPRADVIILSVPDNAVAEVAQRLAAAPAAERGTVVLHLSGAKTVAELEVLVKQGCEVGSLHPVFAFADVDSSVAGLAGSLCALEAGSPAALAVLRRLAAALGLAAFEIGSLQKARYHASLSAASNFSVALAAFAQDLLRPLDLPEDLSRQLVCGLMRQSVENLEKLPPLQALTGPIVRGDDSTVSAHLSVMDEEERRRYRIWAQATLALAAERLDEAAVERLRSVLGDGR